MKKFLRGKNIRLSIGSIAVLLYICLIILSFITFNIYSLQNRIEIFGTSIPIIGENEFQEEDTGILTDASLDEHETAALSETETVTGQTKPADTPEGVDPTPRITNNSMFPTAIVAFYADNQSDTDEEDLAHQNVVDNIMSSLSNPVFHAGDIMEDGTQDSLDRFNTVTADMRANRDFYAALGNNDREIGDSSIPSHLFLDNFEFPGNERWYSINYGNLHMVVLDSAFAWDNQTQINWLISDLQSDASQDRITCVMFHHPTFTSEISSYLVNYGVDFVVSGHLHSYSHSVSDGINYFVLSGQPNLGYMRAVVFSDRVTMVVSDQSNTIIDTVTFYER